MSVFRYVLRRDVLRLGWLGPSTVFLITVASFLPLSAPLGGSLGIILIATLVLAGWVSVISVSGDDPGQKTVVSVQGGGLIRTRVQEAAAAFVVAVSFGWIGLAVAALRAVDLPASTGVASRLGIAASMVLVAALLGVAIGFALAWPVLQRQPLAISAVVVVCLILVVTPVSPVHGLLACAAEIDRALRGWPITVAVAGIMLVAGGFGVAGGYATGHRWRLGRPE